MFRLAPGRFQKGFSLLEVLVAGAITSSGLAGLAALLLASVAGTAQSSSRTTAVLLAEGLVSEIRVSPGAEQTFLQSPPDAILHCNADNACSTAQFSAANLKLWQIELADRLPGGTGVVCRDSTPFDGSDEDSGCDGSAPLVVKVFWQSTDPDKSSHSRVVQVVQ